MKTCNICNRPADDGYVNEAAHERCMDPCHDRNGVRVIPGAGPGREWGVEELHPSGAFYTSRGNFVTLAAAEREAAAAASRRAPHDADTPFMVKLAATGAEAYAETAEAALRAARQLVDDALEANPAFGRKTTRETVYIVENGSYAGILTAFAREGFELAPLAARSR